MNFWSRVSLLVAVFLGLVSFVRVGQADELVVYSGRGDTLVKPVMEAFTQETGIKVILHNAHSTELLNKLQLEGNKTQADLYLSNDAGNLQLGSDLGLFRPLPVKMVEVIKPNLRASDNTWVGLSARARVLVVNSQNHNADFIKSVFDLADPRLKGRLAITNSSNESFMAGTTVYMYAAGKDKTRKWLQGMKDNVGAEVFDKHNKIVSEVANGKKDVGLVNHYYIYRHLAETPDTPIRIVFPDQGEGGMGVAWNVAGIAISKYSQKSDLAEKLIEFLVSERGQKMFAEANREYPARNGVPAAPEVAPADTFKIADVPMSELGTQRDATIDLIEDVGMP